jgi:uncharacterized protein (TIGR01777 family)
MKIIIAGGTGFLGQPLTEALSRAGHALVVLSRNPSHSATAGSAVIPWVPGASGAWTKAVDGAGAVVNLAGTSIAGHRWSGKQKRLILESRLLATRSLVEAMRSSPNPPAVFVSASAVGFYGPHGDEPIDEEQPPGGDFLAHVCRQWEAEAAKAADIARVVLLRTGLVLARHGGALPQMLLPFKLGAGGPLGSGRQYWPWIHLEDWIALAKWTIDEPAVTGPVNLTAPAPVTNREFAKRLGVVLRRPALVAAPGFALRLLLGEMADGLLLSGQRAVPEKAQRLGFKFRFSTLTDALRDIFPAGSPR